MIVTSSGEVFQLPLLDRATQGVALITPKGKFCRQERRAIDSYKFLYVVVEADPLSDTAPTLGPDDFDLDTLKWALKRGTLILIWGGSIPFEPDGLTKVLKDHVRPKGRIVIILSQDDRWEEWTRFAFEHAPTDAQFAGVRGLPEANCPTSGAVH